MYLVTETTTFETGSIGYSTEFNVIKEEADFCFEYHITGDQESYTEIVSIPLTKKEAEEYCYQLASKEY